MRILRLCHEPCPPMHDTCHRPNNELPCTDLIYRMLYSDHAMLTPSNVINACLSKTDKPSLSVVYEPCNALFINKGCS